MPKVKYEEGKGLYQENGTGIELVPSAGVGLNYKKPVTSIITATRTVTAAESGTIFTINKADGVTITLPAAVAGLHYSFHLGVTSTGTVQIDAASSADTLQGIIEQHDKDDPGTVVLMNEGVTTTAWSAPIAADHQLILNNDQDGRFIGGYVKYRCITKAIWLVEGRLFGNGTVTHQFD